MLVWTSVAAGVLFPFGLEGPSSPNTSGSNATLRLFWGADSSSSSFFEGFAFCALSQPETKIVKANASRTPNMRDREGSVMGSVSKIGQRTDDHAHRIITDS